MTNPQNLVSEFQSNQWQLPLLYTCSLVAAVATQVEVGYLTDWP